MTTEHETEPEIEKVTYLVQQAGGDFVIELDPGWRLTFAYVNPAKSEEGYRRNEAHCLRVYEGQKLRAVFGNVTGFRDLSIPLARKFTKETGSAQWTQDSEGNFDRSEKVAIERSYFDDEISFEDDHQG